MTSWLAAGGDATAMVFDGERWSYAQLARESARLAGGLAALGVRRGDRVAVLGHNSHRYLALVFACARLGAALVPLNWRLAAPEHAFQLRDSAPTVVLAGPDFAAHLGDVRAHVQVAHWRALEAASAGWPALDGTQQPPPDVGRADDPLLLVYTSGTTGRPKGALLTQAAVAWNARLSVDAHALTRDDVVLTDLPLFHVGGLNIQTLPALSVGARVELMARFEPGPVLARIESAGVTVNLCVPATMHALVEHPRWREADLSSLRLTMTGSSVVPHALLEAFFARGLVAGQVYGSTETCPVVVCLRADDAQAQIGSCGKPVAPAEAKVVRADGRNAAAGERGEIVVRAPNLFSGYWRDDAATERVLRNGWFHTGDIGHVNAKGYFFVDDRKGDVIVSGGENVYPAEVEQHLARDPDIAECAVVARAHPRWGAVPIAVVVPRDGVVIDADAVRRRLDGQLARYKLPHEVLVRDSLPRNAMGKVLRYRLRASLEADATGQSDNPAAGVEEP